MKDSKWIYLSLPQYDSNTDNTINRALHIEKHVNFMIMYLYLFDFTDKVQQDIISNKISKVVGIKYGECNM